MPLARVMEPEWLDDLPADDPRAMRSRRDLKRVNSWMMQTRIMAGLMLRYGGVHPPRHIVDLGTGDGGFALRVAEIVAPRWAGASITLLDRQNIVSSETLDAFRALGWSPKAVSEDVFAFAEEKRQPGKLITANLFLHHLSMSDLARLFALVANSADMLIACEPRRNGFALLGSRMLFVIGCNDVSRHDAVASVRAGFCGHELSALWPDVVGWELHEALVLPFTHAFVAVRAGSRR